MPAVPAPRSLLRNRSLRFRLTFSYIALFALALIGLGFAVRSVLSNVLLRQSENALNQQWNVVRGFLRVEGGVHTWAYDRDDPEEAAIVGNLRGGVYLLASASGEILEVSENYRELINLTPAQIRQRVQRNANGFETRRDQYKDDYLLRHGIVLGDRTPFYVVIGRPLVEDAAILDQFTRNYFLFMPLGIAAICLAGWIAAGAALRPLAQVAAAAQAITGQKLNLRIPESKAEDELDGLIKAFNAMIERLEQSFAQIRQFSTDVSHELRTPLTIIRGHLEVALMTAQTKEQYQDAIHTALQDVERLGKVVRALLQLSQAESGQLVLNKAPMDLAAVTRDMAEHLLLAAEDKAQELTIDCPAPAVTLADRVQIERLITNLLSNAIKYTPVAGRIQLTVKHEGAAVVLSVTDTGQGIPAAHLPHIFDRFYRVPNSTANPERGLGLGLSFVNWIAHAHGGSVHVASEPGRGSCFTVTLPALPATEPAAPAAVATTAVR